MTPRKLAALLSSFGMTCMAGASVAAQPAGDASESGKQIATQGVQGAAPCASCHGQQGEGNAAAGFPRIAGQSAVYLAHQLESYVDGTRKSPVMAPIAKALDARQRQAVAAYYAQLAPGAKGQAVKPPAGKAPRVATVGDDARQIQACGNCHGPGGMGEPPTYPYLASQHAQYLVTALGEWKSGARNNDSTGQMSMIAKRLTDAEVKSLAQYYASQPAPRSATAMLSMTPPKAEGPAPAPKSAAGPKTATPAKGVGVEPAAPTRGGAQGPGGAGAASGAGPLGSKTGNAP